MSIVISSDVPGTKFEIHRYGVVLRLTREELMSLSRLITLSLRPVSETCYDSNEEYREEVEVDEYV